jgi:hypothetical protein
MYHGLRSQFAPPDLHAGQTLPQFNQWLLDEYGSEGDSLWPGSRWAICLTQPICGLRAAVARSGLRSGVVR